MFGDQNFTSSLLFTHLYSLPMLSLILVLVLELVSILIAALCGEPGCSSTHVNARAAIINQIIGKIGRKGNVNN